MKELLQKRKLRWRERIIIFIVCVAINLMGKAIAVKCGLPIWLDMQGTCVAAYFLGLPGGILVAVLNNVIFAVHDRMTLIYTLAGMVSAILLWFLSKKGYLEKFRTAVFASFWLGICCMAVSTPLNIFLYDGYSGNRWGDALVDMMDWYGFNRIFAALAGEFVVEIIDKQICMILGFFLIKGISHILFDKKSGKTAKRKKKPESKQVVAGLLALVMLSAALWPAEMVYGAINQENESQYSAQIYNNQNGMMSSEANAIAETEDGYIWIGSYAGLTRYDGTSFTFMKDSGIASVKTMFCDSKGRLWIGTNDGGIARYEEGAFRYFNTEDGLPSDSIRCFYEDEQGNMYVGTTDHLCVVDKEDHIREIDEELTYVMSISGDGDLIVCVDKNGDLFVLQDDEICVDTTEEQSDVFYNCIFSTSMGLAVGTAGEGIYILDVNKGGISLKKHFQTPVQSIWKIKENEEGQIWICGENGFGYLKEDGTYHAQETEDFHASCEDIHEDYQGNMWVASSRYGVLRLSKSPFFNLFTHAKIDGEVTNAVVRYAGCFYCGTDNGLVILDDEGNIRKNELTELLDGDRVRSLFVDSQKRLWICTYGSNGLVCADGKKALRSYTCEREPLVTSDRARCITELSDGSLAVGTTDGIYFIDGGDVTGNLTKQDGLSNSQILSLTEKDHVLYAGSDGAGIFRIQDGEIIENITKEDGLSSNIILRLVSCEQGMLVVTGNSLCFMGDTITILDKFPYFNNYDIVIFEDLAYVLSSAGIYEVDVEALCTNDEMYDTLYNAQSGLNSAITANSWNYISKDGVLYFCCNDGVVQFSGDSWMKNVNYCYGISEVNCDGVSVEMKDGIYQIPAQTRKVVVEPVVKSYTLMDVKVKFFMEGYEDETEPVSFTSIEPIQLNNLSAGTYRMHLQLYDASGRQLLEERSFQLEKEPQMWENWWYNWYLVLVIFETAGFVIWSVAMIIEHFREKDRLKIFAEMLEEKVSEQTKELKERQAQKEELLTKTVTALSETVDAKDRYTSGHSRRVAMYSKMIAQRMGKEEWEQEEIYSAGLLHDVGKIRVPEEIINKPGRLTDEEFDLIKLHPVTGYHILKEISEDHFYADGAHFHHERYDGKGYPNGLTGESIPEIARIIGVADAYDAMASNRSYREALPQEVVREEIIKGRGTQFDPKIADIMLQMIDEDKEYLMKQTESMMKHILAVDDETMNLILVEYVLKDEAGYRFYGATSGQEALDILNRENIDLVLLDVRMPDMDGFETLVHIREKSNVPVVFMTADKQALKLEQSRALGVEDFVTKPFMPAVLKEILHAVLSE